MEDSKLSKTTLELIKEHYIFSNTPSYLFRHLRQISSLYQHSRDSKSDEVIIRIKSVLASLESLDQLMEIYGLIVLLSYKDETLAKNALNDLSFIDLDWIGNLSKLAMELWIPLTEISVPTSGSIRVLFSEKMNTDSDNAWQEEHFNLTKRSSK